MKAVSAVIAALLSVSSTPSVAENWNCSFKSLMSGERGVSGNSEIEVSGTGLKWSLPPPPGGHTRTIFRYDILDNNASGLISVLHIPRLQRKAGSAFGAQLILLDKETGTFRMGSVTTIGVSDVLAGKCRSK